MVDYFVFLGKAELSIFSQGPVFSRCAISAQWMRDNPTRIEVQVVMGMPMNHGLVMTIAMLLAGTEKESRLHGILVRG